MANSSHQGKAPLVHSTKDTSQPTAQFEQTPDQLSQEQLHRTLEALHRSEQRHAFLLQQSDTLRPLGDPQLILDEAARVLGQFLGANRVGYAETQEDAQMAAVTRNFTQGVPPIEGIYRYRDYGPQLLESMQRGQTVIRPDIAHDPTLTQAEKQAHAQLQLGATLNVPLVKQGHLVAILFVHYQQAHAFSAHEVALAQETAERTWAYVEQVRSEVTLQQSQQQLSAIIHQATAGIARTDPDGTFTFVNEQYCQQIGYESAELLGRRMQALTHPDDLARNQSLFDRLGQYGEPFEIEKRYVRKDGTLIWVHNHVSAIRNPTGEITQLLAVSVDITARKQAEEALAASEARYRALAGELEERVQVRTGELQQANQELTPLA
jgi:PAS domain S-box-containing protein